MRQRALDMGQGEQLVVCRKGIYTEGKLYSSEIVSRELARRFRDMKGYPDIDVCLILGLIRSGTTALQMVMSHLDFRFSEFQPFKNLFRQGPERATCFIYGPGKEVTPLLLKETVGPELDEECAMDPVGMLIDAGISPRRIRAVFLLREPHHVYHSLCSLGLFKDVTPPVEGCKTAMDNLIMLYEHYKPVIAAAVPFVYELLEESPEKMLKELLTKLGLTSPDLSLGLDESVLRKKMWWNEASAQTYWDDVIAPMLHGGRFQYRVRPAPKLPSFQAAFIEEHMLPGYLKWRKMVETEFGSVLKP